MRRVVVLVAAAVVATAGASAMVAFAYSGPTPGEVYRVWLEGREIDVSRSASGRIATGNNRYFGTLSPDRQLVAEVATVGRSVALRVSRLDGSHVQTFARRAPCPALVEGDMQWLPDSRSLVYDLRCQPNH